MTSATSSVRAAINVDPVTAQVTTASDPIPQILEGIPLRIRSILVNLDRPGFTLNPTNCEPHQRRRRRCSATKAGQSSPQSHFQVANCADLPYGPKLASTVAEGLTKRRGHPAVRAELTTTPGEANTAGSRSRCRRTSCSTTPTSAPSAPGCSSRRTRARPIAIYGTATATTPLLDQPLTGPVYLRSSTHKLPDLVADLHGQIEIELAGKIDTAKKGGLRATFETVPDAPVTKFVLELQGGKKGLLVNSKSLCKSDRKATVDMTGQNGRTDNGKVKLGTACGSKASRHKRHQRKAVR